MLTLNEIGSYKELLEILHSFVDRIEVPPDDTVDPDNFIYYDICERVVNNEARIMNSLYYHRGGISEPSNFKYKIPPPIVSANWAVKELEDIEQNELAELPETQSSKLRERIDKAINLVPSGKERSEVRLHLGCYYRIATELNDLCADWEIFMIKYKSGEIDADKLYELRSKLKSKADWLKGILQKYSEDE